MGGSRATARWAAIGLLAAALGWLPTTAATGAPASGGASDAARGPAAWKAIGGGESHTCGVGTNGTMWCWGYNGFGQLGDGTEDDHRRPNQVGSATNWKTVAVGTYHSCGLRTNDTLWCWGMNGYGQIGDGNGGFNVEQREPVRVGSSTWTSVTLGEYHSCGVRSDGSGWCWGNNSNGQAGDNTAGTNRLDPVRVKGTGDWSSMSAGGAHSCGLKTNGSAWCWGYNGSGEVGDGTTDNSRLRPVRVGTATNWTSVAVGYQHSCGVRANRTAWCWGDNIDGQVGSGGLTSEYPTPTKVVGAGWTAVFAGDLHGCGIKQDKSLWCWGANAAGQLGDNGTSPRNSPAQVSGGGTWRTAGGGSEHSCGVKTNGSAWCWGYNFSGQLGDGTVQERHVPVRVRN